MFESNCWDKRFGKHFVSAFHPLFLELYNVSLWNYSLEYKQDTLRGRNSDFRPFCLNAQPITFSCVKISFSSLSIITPA